MEQAPTPGPPAGIGHVACTVTATRIARDNLIPVTKGSADTDPIFVENLLVPIGHQCARVFLIGPEVLRTAKRALAEELGLLLLLHIDPRVASTGRRLRARAVRKVGCLKTHGPRFTGLSDIGEHLGCPGGYVVVGLVEGLLDAGHLLLIEVHDQGFVRFNK